MSLTEQERRRCRRWLPEDAPKQCPACGGQTKVPAERSFLRTSKPSEGLLPGVSVDKWAVWQSLA